MRPNASVAAGRLAGRSAIVTGGLSGIGRAIAGLFAAEGATVLIVDIREESRDDQQSADDVVRELGPSVAFARGDVSEAEDVRSLFTRAETPDIVVNNAGVTAFKPIEETSDGDLQRILDINVKAVFIMCREAVSQWSQANVPGVIVNVASNFGLVGSPDAVAYCASKGAVVSLTKALAAEVAGRGIRVNALCPGATATEFNRAFREEPGVLERWEAKTPLRVDGERFLALPREIAPAALFLASADATFMTGATLTVDGGWNCA